MSSSDSTAPKVRFHYFPGTARGNQVRLALAAGGVEWEDAFVSLPTPTPEDIERCLKLTNNNTTYLLPILTLDEGTDQQKVYLQTSAQMRKAARMGDLKMTLENDPDGDQAAYLTDRAIGDAEDLRSASYRGFQLFIGATQEASDKFIKVVFPKHVKSLENQFVSAGGDYWGGSSTLSIADIAIYDAVVNFGTNLIDGIEGVENPCGPAMKAWIDRVSSNPRIKAYFESEQYGKLHKIDKATFGY